VAGNNTPLSFSWSEILYDLVINVATDGSGNPTSTASDIRSMILADLYMADRFRISFKAGNSGSGIVTVMAHTHFMAV
jgi:hypothetical protein